MIPVMKGASAPPELPALEMNAIAVFWVERGSRRANTTVADG